MNSIKEYFHTDCGAMTPHDWIGLIMTIVVFLLMIALYVYVLKPSNKEKLESHRFIPLDEEHLDPGFNEAGLKDTGIKTEGKK